MNFGPLQSGNNYCRLLKLTSTFATLFGYKHKKFGPNRTRINGVCHWHDMFDRNQWKTLKMAVFLTPLQSRNNWVRVFQFMSPLATLSDFMHKNFKRKQTKINWVHWLKTENKKMYNPGVQSRETFFANIGAPHSPNTGAKLLKLTSTIATLFGYMHKNFEQSQTRIKVVGGIDSLLQ